VPVDAYRNHMRVRSPRWGTVALPTAAFRALVRPFRDYTHGKQFADGGPPAGSSAVTKD
jgi:hypothetical protein